MLTAGIFLLFYIHEKKFERVSSHTKRILTIVSVASFGVYLTHELVYQVLRFVFISSHQTLLLRTDLITDYLRAILVFTLSTILVLAIKQVPYLKRIVP